MTEIQQSLCVAVFGTDDSVASRLFAEDLFSIKGAAAWLKAHGEKVNVASITAWLGGAPEDEQDIANEIYATWEQDLFEDVGFDFETFAKYMV